MASIDLRVEGLDDVLKQLDGFALSEYVLRDALKAGGEAILPDLVAAAPVRARGNIPKAMRYTIRSGKKGLELRVGVLHNDVPYAHLVEFGHGGVKAAPEHPFVRPVIKADQQKVMDAMRAKILEGLKLK